MFSNEFSFQKLISLLESNKDTELVTSPLINEFGAIQHVWMEEGKNNAHTWENTHSYSGVFLEDTQLQKDDVHEIDLCTGAMVLLRKEFIEEIGGWDESFIIGDFEDNVLCHQIKRRGKKIMTDVSQSAIHIEGSSFVRTPFKFRVNQKKIIDPRKW